MKRTIWAHTIVKNEERYLWFAIMSVASYVDKILLWDTGSTDNTLKIIDELIKRLGRKISFKEIGPVNPEEFTQARQKMLEETKSDWLMVLDGDEVWNQQSIQTIIKTIQASPKSLETIVSPCYNIIGDIYHYQEEEAGQYSIDGKTGHLNIRFINNQIPGLHLEKPHGQQGFYDQSGLLIQNRPSENRLFIDAPYFHFTNMIRSCSQQKDLLVPKRNKKYKYEIGLTFPKDFHYPEVFYQDYPQFIPSPWQHMSMDYLLRAYLETFLKKFKRSFFPSAKVGY